MGEHSCSLGKRGGFRERLDDGTWLGHVAEHVALELQRESGAHISRGKTRSAGASGQYNVIYGYAEEYVGLEAGRLAVRLVNHLVKPEPGFDFAAELERLILLAERRQFGPSTQAILDEAASRDIPCIRLNEQSLVQLGQGKYQQRIRATMTSQTSALAVDIAGDKKMTNSLLGSAGLPVPQERGRADRGRCRRGRQADRVPGGHEAAGRQPRARASGWTCAPSARCARASSARSKESRNGRVVVETFVTGNDYRVLVIGGRMVAIAERVPAHVDRRRQAHGRRAGRDRRTRTPAAASATRRC